MILGRCFFAFWCAVSCRGAMEICYTTINNVVS